MSTVVYTSAAAADKALQNFRGGKVGEYDITVRPYANKDSYTVFVGGLLPNIDNATLEQYFSEYQPMLSCSLAPYNMSKPTRNATITFGSKYSILDSDKSTTDSWSNTKKTRISNLCLPKVIPTSLNI